MSKLLTTLVIAATLLCGACGDGGNGDDPMAGATAAGFLNATCPIGGDPVEADGGSVEFQGHKIGFCCDMCIEKFDGLSDPEKIAKLADVGTKLP